MAARKQKGIWKNVIGSFTHETNAGGLSDGGLIVTPADVGAETIELGFADGGAVDPRHGGVVSRPDGSTRNGRRAAAGYAVRERDVDWRRRVPEHRR